MSAARLREAAAAIRRQAREAADGMTPPSRVRGPLTWVAAEVLDCACCQVVRTKDQGAEVVRGDDRMTGHVALWSPPVALAVAAWLDEVAARDGAHYWRGIKPALVVANLILASQP